MIIHFIPEYGAPPLKTPILIMATLGQQNIQFSLLASGIQQKIYLKGDKNPQFQKKFCETLKFNSFIKWICPMFQIGVPAEKGINNPEMNTKKVFHFAKEIKANQKKG